MYYILECRNTANMAAFFFGEEEGAFFFWWVRRRFFLCVFFFAAFFFVRRFFCAAFFFVRRLFFFVRLSKFNYVFQPCNVTFQFDEIVPTSYDEYTALVKSGNVASKHVNGW